MYGKEAKKKNRRDGWHILAIAGVITLVATVYLMGAPTHTEYQYDLKAEQVYDNDKIEEAVALEELSEEEQALLHDAFKKSDHFFGSSEVTVSTQEKFETYDGWQVVEFQGVYMILAIEGPDAHTMWSGALPYIIGTIWLFGAAGVLLGLKMVVLPSRYRY